MTGASKYTRQFFPVKDPPRRWAQKTYVDRAPAWCSVDLRDGNQALVVPMSLEEKLEFFDLLVRMGFQEIEVGFPAASETEFAFVRALIEQDRIPQGVTIQVLTQGRPHIIERTFQALAGCRNAIVHLYTSISPAHREQVYQKTPDEIVQNAVESAALFVELAGKYGVSCRFEYSPESFTAAEPEFALRVCNAVLDVWKPTPDKKAVIDLPVTVELSAPHVYADQVEYMSDRLRFRDAVVLSLHPHNDRGCAVAAAELGLLAGAQRVEGTLFGNGERTGNVDLITLALNLYAQGVEPGLDLSDLPAVEAVYERLTRMRVHDRQPYSGKLVFAAFSGSHQDAIAKAMRWRDAHPGVPWTVPYLAIDPTDVGRQYESDVIRINSQSGKGGIGYLLEHTFGYVLPPDLRREVGMLMKSVSDREHTELSPQRVLDIFTRTYVNRNAPIRLVDFHFDRRGSDIRVVLSVDVRGTPTVLHSTGNGRLNAVSYALQTLPGIRFTQINYEEHALDHGPTSQAISYMSIIDEQGRKVWGVGLHGDMLTSSIQSLISAVNRSLAGREQAGL